jgi:pilus assembly protein CpaF
MMSGYDLPEPAIRHQIASAIDLIVQVDRLPDGSRKVTKITELTGMEGEVITMQDIYDLEWKMEENGKAISRHRCTGIRPQCATKLLDLGKTLPKFAESSTVSVSPKKLETKSDFHDDDDSFLKVR